MNKKSHLKVLIAVCLGGCFIFSGTFVFTQDTEVQELQKLKLKLWSILKQNRIQPAASIAELTEDQIKTLNSITKVNGYPIYEMTYYGDYGFEDFIKVGHPVGSQVASLPEGCSSFGALHAKGYKIFGRNLDLTKLYPLCIVYTQPPDGYASVSLHIGVDVEYYLGDPTNLEYISWVLELPYMTFDGMNEYGVAVAGLNVAGEEIYDPDKIMLSRYEMRRLVLDYARNVDEAILLIQQYNNQGSATVHYLVSDAHGDSAIIEYHDGQVQAYRNVESWQAATNFMLKGSAPDSVLGSCIRYDAMYEQLYAYKGRISRWTGMNILALVARYHEPAGDDLFIETVWSGIYDLTRGWLEVYPGTRFEIKERFPLAMINDLAIEQARIKPRTPSSGEDVEIYVRVRNLSPRMSRSTGVKLYLCQNQQIEEDSILLGRWALEQIPASKAKTVFIQSNLREAIPSGSYYLVALVDQIRRNNDPELDNNRFVWDERIVLEK